eukprot:CAMPEP_0168596338 /NCGR_PEP_ID=MMETSP0420-20121227/9968_1 /TAXON_ID=498008 /ORGANISM="Pessonella sp." /LENGTH=290 /DNA_ID=CAMNT_0008632897 /DNA_START=268 /DNA_END=1137 /DNA_ORIENTATION=-
MAPTKTFILFGRTVEEKYRWIRWLNNVVNGRPLDYGKATKPEKKQAKTKAAQPESDSDELEFTEDEEVEEEVEEEEEQEEDAFEEEFDEASEEEDEEDEDDVFFDNPDVESFVPVLPDQFFTPSGAKKGVRAGQVRRTSSGAAASRRRGTGKYTGGVQQITAQTPSDQLDPFGKPEPQPTQPHSAKSAETKPMIDLLTFDDPPPQQTIAPAGTGFFGGAPFGQPQAQPQMNPFGAPTASQNPFGMMAPQQPRQPFGGGAFGQPTQASPFGNHHPMGFGMPQQQQQQQQQQ